MKPIFIIGYMACGKTTFGRALARTIGRRFIDLDFYIEQRFRDTVSGIFAKRGEAGFRQLESAMLREVGEFEDVVIACGGGTPCFGDNMDYMLERGETVWLDTDKDRIVERIIANSSKRPLMAGKNASEIARSVAEGLLHRQSHYARANIRFDGTHLEDRRQISDSVDKFLRAHPTLKL